MLVRDVREMGVVRTFQGHVETSWRKSREKEQQVLPMNERS